MQRRRRFASMDDPIPVAFRIERATKERLAALASRSQITQSEMLELLVQHSPLDHAGIPLCLPRDRYPELEPELPMTG